VNTHGADLKPKKHSELSEPRVQQENPVEEIVLPELGENGEVIKAEFSNFLSEEDMERMDQLITGINEWANKYGENAEDFYPDFDEFLLEDEEEIEAIIDEDSLIGGGDHDLWWFTEEEKQAYRQQKEDEEIFGVVIEYNDNGEVIINIERDTWMGLAEAESSPRLEMTIEVPDSW